MTGALIAALAVFVYVWQGKIHPCQDGNRYTSGKLQPTPFNRRFCSWPPRLLMLVTWASFIAIAATLTWKQALLFVTLPGVAFCTNLPTTTDGPAMLLAWMSAMAMQSGHPTIAVMLSTFSGSVHERAPVFAALYAWSPWPLLGLALPVFVGWLKGSAAPDRSSPDPAERFVGHSLWSSLEAHRNYVDLLAPSGLLWSLRGLPVMAGHLGVSLQAWACLGVAYASRLVGTDTSRFLMWGALPMIRELDPPLWMLALQTMSFRRVGQ